MRRRTGFPEFHFPVLRRCPVGSSFPYLPHAEQVLARPWERRSPPWERVSHVLDGDLRPVRGTCTVEKRKQRIIRSFIRVTPGT
ncbi:nucleoprotein [Clarias magur]|uniref:Nucleoprotein n=1 Tax=Clarias magur TaxID=1594786 RepID=A0A8J4TAX7_CLAMG|nr:nucleoprotein [Clarias magur]